MNEETPKRQIAILGATGSIGTQALEVIDQNPDYFEVSVLTANDNHELLIEQALKYQPNAVVICNEAKYQLVKDALKNELIKVYAGHDAVDQIVQTDEVDVVLTAMVGFAGLRSTIKAIEAKKVIALANKETLVVAGEIITQLADEYRVPILPVDSEHSAIFQCLAGERYASIEKLILTASGGPFRGYDIDKLAQVSRADALKHPNWEMGQKITIDSASLMNKGLEVIEAKWLFGLNPEQIEVVVHPQSIIHSMVQFNDGSIKAQMGLPDMRLPIQYALAYPHRLKNALPRFSFHQYKSLTFEQPDLQTFRNLALAFEAMAKGGNGPCVLNAANEIAVEAFLKAKISFLKMSDIIENSLQNISHITAPSLQDYFETDKETRTYAKHLTGL
ncbi:MAG: 1-deoxy-D-xylulose-5-phosphate reductoisomerase [Sphingobacteriales bacterium]|nr:MAG: 1-deoxy-D-xylulose-5-phosphate reductoisomerase [Sphingobacteriales bacterium]